MPTFSPETLALLPSIFSLSPKLTMSVDIFSLSEKSVYQQ